MGTRRGRLIIVCGLPGTGKTTRALALAEDTGGIRFSPDDWLDALAINLWDIDARRRVEQLQWQVATQVLSSGGTAIIEWGTWSREERETLRQEAAALGARTALVYLTAPPEELYERISRRGRETPPITLDEVRAWAAAIEAPTDVEFALYDPGQDR